MKKVLLAIALLAVSSVANAVQVWFVRHKLQTSDGDPTTVITDRFDGFGPPATTATWDWDGTTLTATGTYSAAIYVGSVNTGPSVLRDRVVNLSIDTSTRTATATSYQCDNGTFLGFVHFCGGYTYGSNYVNESTVSYGPGLAFDITIGGDDNDSGPTGAAGVRNLSRLYAFGLNSWDGRYLSVGTGVPAGRAGYEEMLFHYIPVPPAMWLFGSAVALLGWMSRRSE